MPKITTTDGTEIYYKDWGTGKPVVLSHGWPLCADAWDAQMLFLADQGYRVIAHDRRGHGRSGQPWTGNNMDTFADDLACLIETLDLTGVALFGHSMGGGEVARYVGRHGTSRIAKLGLISAVPPIMLKSDSNPNGAPMSVFDGIRAGVTANRSQFYKEFAVPFHNLNRADAPASEGIVDSFWHLGMMGSIKSQLDCVKQFSETDFTEDLGKINVPTLILHGDDDQIVPISLTAMRTAEIVKDSTLKIYPGGSHGICSMEAAKVNQDLLQFISM